MDFSRQKKGIFLLPLFRVTMVTNGNSKNPQKSPKIFLCVECNYKCFNKKDYNKHILTRKHQMITNGNKKSPKIPKNPLMYICSCGRSYKYKSGLSRHKKNCTYNEEISETQEIIVEKTDDDDYKNLIYQVMNENKELRTLLVKQNQEHKEENTKLQNTIHSMIPKIGNTTNNQQFNINFFLNEECKNALNFSDFIKQIKITQEDLENQGQKGYIDGISKIFLDHLLNLGLTERPIHCTDVKRNTLYIKENNEWDKKDSKEQIKKGIREITRKGQKSLLDMKTNNNEEYSDMDSEFSNKCLNIQRNLVPVEPRDTTMSKIVTNISQNTLLDK